MRRVSFFQSLWWISAAWTVAAGAAIPAGKSYEKDVLPLLQTYCWDCHGDGAHKGELNLDKYTTANLVVEDRKIWSGVLFHIDQWTMPPAKRKDQPTPQERELLTSFLDHLLNPVDPERPDPGRVTIRRLNRVEYNNTVRDLLGVDLRPADDFPEDDTGYGFDNIGDVLALPPILMERYLIAADRVLNAAIPPPPPGPELTAISGDGLTGQGLTDGKVRFLGFNGETGSEYAAPIEGEYQLRARVWADQAGNEPAKLELIHANKVVQTAAITASSPDNPQIVETTIRMAKGGNQIGVRFTNDFYQPEGLPEGKRDRNLYVQFLEVNGPVKVDPVPMPESAKRIFEPGKKAGETVEGARAILQQFANRCFRRAALPAEVERLLGVYQLARGKGEPHSNAVRLAMKVVMVSPWFLYRTEWQPEADNPGKVVDVDDFALASRLSYWLWSSTPDDELLSLAFRKQLRPELRNQVIRMLKDPKSRALPENFGGQWLQLRTLNVVAPDQEKFPEFGAGLAMDMRRETEEFFQYIVKENRPVTEFLSADYSFLNERLAKFYGIGGVAGENFRKVSYAADSRRRGILTHASVLTVTSDPTRTSPVKRGKWILENMLGIEPPPPPPNVPTLEEGESGALTGTVRQRLEAHRSQPGCASCHALIDPLGFGLENFDAIGRWRDKDGGTAIDSAGVLTTGQTFGNATELSQILLTDRRQAYLRALTSKMLTYALGRGTEAYDRPAIDQIMAKMEKEEFRFQSLILGIAESLPFQKRRGDSRH